MGPHPVYAARASVGPLAIQEHGDPTGKVKPDGLVRVATGRDAADIAFMTIFGQAQLVTQTFAIAQTA